MTEATSAAEGSMSAALAAYERGYVPIPIRAREKRPYGSEWTRIRWSSPEQVTSAFTGWQAEGATNLGLLLGEPSGGLVDVDLDNALAVRLGPIVLTPGTAMMSGRTGRPKSHYWYKATGEVPGYRKYTMPDGSTCVELRSTGGQTVIPPSIHPDGKPYRWEGEAWGGEKGPTEIEGKTLARQVAGLALLAVLLENWPKQGSRHDAYLALAGGMLRWGDNGVHPWWEKHLEAFIRAMAAVTHDHDDRVGEVIPSTLTALRSGKPAVGFTRLAEIIGPEHAEKVKRQKAEIESLTTVRPEPVPLVSATVEQTETLFDPDAVVSTLPPQVRNPMEERVSTWDRVDMEPYILGQVVLPDPTVLMRADGCGLIYPGRVNALYGASESGKSWVALLACTQEIGKGERTMFIDFEDSPEGTWKRLRLLGVAMDDMIQFAYVHPEDAMADMMRSRFSGAPDERTIERAIRFKALLASFDPTLIVVDGMTTLYSTHSLDTNQAGDTDVISTWLKGLTRYGRSTVVVIDHTGKGSEGGDAPIGAHHKVAMVQGSSLQVVSNEPVIPGVVNRVELLVHKDRPGSVRKVSVTRGGKKKIQIAAVVMIDSTSEEEVRITLEPPPPAPDPAKGELEVEITEEALAKAESKATKRLEAELAAEKAARLREHLVTVGAGQALGRSTYEERLLEHFNEAPGEEATREALQALCEDPDSGWEQSGYGRHTTYGPAPAP